VPEDEQSTAFLEIERILAPGASAAVVYSWGAHSILMKLAFLPAWVVISVLRAFKGKKSGVDSGEGLYFHAHTYSWLAREISSRIDAKILTWRSVSIPFMRTFVHGWLFGSAFLSIIYGLEESFPRLFGRIGAYPMIVIKKGRRE
jgi:hypothetical protein